MPRFEHRRTGSSTARYGTDSTNRSVGDTSTEKWCVPAIPWGSTVRDSEMVMGDVDGLIGQSHDGVMGPGDAL
jgi:hypothetical protein